MALSAYHPLALLLALALSLPFAITCFIPVASAGVALGSATSAEASGKTGTSLSDAAVAGQLATHPSPVAYWNFNGTAPLVDRVRGYRLLLNTSNPVEIVDGAADFHEGQRLHAPRSTVPRLANISGPTAQVCGRDEHTRQTSWVRYQNKFPYSWLWGTAEI